MAIVILNVATPIISESGLIYRARVCGRERDDGLWEGWIEFDCTNGSVVRSPRATTQPNLTDLEYWATGLSSIYLEGTLKRALAPISHAATREPVGVPVFDGPAPPLLPVHTPEAVLDPYSIYRKDPELLVCELSALHGRHLRQIIWEYEMADPEVNLELLPEPEMIELIVRRVADDLRGAA